MRVIFLKQEEHKTFIETVLANTYWYTSSIFY